MAAKCHNQKTKTEGASVRPTFLPPGDVIPSCWIQLLGDGVPCHRVMSLSGPAARGGSPHASNSHVSEIVTNCGNITKLR